MVEAVRDLADSERARNCIPDCPDGFEENHGRVSNFIVHYNNRQSAQVPFIRRIPGTSRVAGTFGDPEEPSMSMSSTLKPRSPQTLSPTHSHTGSSPSSNTKTQSSLLWLWRRPSLTTGVSPQTSSSITTSLPRSDDTRINSVVSKLRRLRPSTTPAAVSSAWCKLTLEAASLISRASTWDTNRVTPKGNLRRSLLNAEVKARVGLSPSRRVMIPASRLSLGARGTPQVSGDVRVSSREPALPRPYYSGE
jgi:hypothetical protein